MTDADLEERILTELAAGPRTAQWLARRLSSERTPTGRVPSRVVDRVCVALRQLRETGRITWADRDSAAQLKDAL